MYFFGSGCNTVVSFTRVLQGISFGNILEILSSILYVFKVRASKCLCINAERSYYAFALDFALCENENAGLMWKIVFWNEVMGWITKMTYKRILVPVTRHHQKIGFNNQFHVVSRIWQDRQRELIEDNYFFRKFMQI